MRGTNDGGGRDFPHPSRLVSMPNELPVRWVLDFFSGVKRPGLGVDHPPDLDPR